MVQTYIPIWQKSYFISSKQLFHFLTNSTLYLHTIILTSTAVAAQSDADYEPDETDDGNDDNPKGIHIDKLLEYSSVIGSITSIKHIRDKYLMNVNIKITGCVYHNVMTTNEVRCKYKAFSWKKEYPSFEIAPKSKRRSEWRTSRNRPL